MPEPTPIEPTTQGATPTEPAPATEPTDLTAEVEKWKAMARKNEERAKANAAAAKELESFKASQMTEQEKAVAEAKAAGRTEAFGEFGGKLVAAEIRAAAAGRIEAGKLDVLLSGINTASFLTDAGDVDAEKVKTFIDALPEAPSTPTWPALGQGQGGAATTTVDPLTAAVVQKLGN